MDKDSIKAIQVPLFDAERNVDHAKFCLEVLVKAPNQEKHMQRLKKAQGLINKVKRDLNRLV